MNINFAQFCFISFDEIVEVIDLSHRISQSSLNLFLLEISSLVHFDKFFVPALRLIKFIQVVSESNVEPFYLLTEQNKFVLIFVDLAI